MSSSSSVASPKQERSRRTKPRGKGSAQAAATATQNYRQRQLEKSRFGIVYDIDGPRVRLGVLWFLVGFGCLFMGLVPFALLIATVCALAAAQTATALRARWRRPDRLVAATVAGLLPVAAIFGTGLCGAVLMAAALGVMVDATVRKIRGTDPLVNAGATMRSALFIGLGGAALVMIYRIDIGAVATIFLLISAYEFGDFLVGSGASNPIEGPASGILALAVVTGAVAAVIGPPPFEGPSLAVFGLAAAMAAPVGQIAASAILPRAGAPARALRRMDSYLLAAPVWLVLLWAGVQSPG